MTQASKDNLRVQPPLLSRKQWSRIALLSPGLILRRVLGPRFWRGLQSPVAYFGNFLEVEVHPGWVGKVSRTGSLVQNPGSNKDAPVDTIAGAVRKLQDERRHLMLLDEFAMPFLYQALKANGKRMLGMYTELDSLLQKCMQAGGSQVVDAKTRMIRIYDCRHGGYGIKERRVSIMRRWKSYHEPYSQSLGQCSQRYGITMHGRTR